MEEAFSKGKLSLAEALQQLETVNNAFVKAERIEKRQLYIDSVLTEIQKMLENFASTSYITSKFEEFSTSIKRQINSQFEEFSTNYLYQLNEKASHSDVKSLIGSRVTWTAFNNYSQQLATMKSRIEKHILSDFEGFKAKIKLELASKAQDKKGEEEITIEEFHNIRNRITSLEQKYHEMFMEEGLDESEDYDSQEEMDNFIEDVGKEKGSEDLDGEAQEDDFEVKRAVESQEVVRSPLSISAGKLAEHKSPDVLSPRSEQVDTAKTEVSEEIKEKEAPKEIMNSHEIKPEIQEIKNEPKIEEKKPSIEIEQQRVKSRSSIEIENNESPGIKRNRAASRADNQTLTRKNSMASSMGGGMGGGNMNGGIRQLNKKVMQLQKDLEGYKASLDQVSLDILGIRDEFVRVYDKIDQTLARAEEVEQNRQAMELSFIKALRRAGMEKKTQRKQGVTAQIDSAELLKIHEKINRRNKRIKEMATFVEKAAADVLCIKDKQNGKINEIVKSVKFLDEARASVSVQVKGLADEVRRVETGLKGEIANVQRQVNSLKGPIVELITDQQRENEILSNSIGGHQRVLTGILEEISRKKIEVQIPKNISVSPGMSNRAKDGSEIRRKSVPTVLNRISALSRDHN